VCGRRCAILTIARKSSFLKGQNMTTKNTERTFELSPAQTKTLQAEYVESQKFPNPYQKGCYRFIVSALTSLGVNKSHNLDAVYQRFQQEAGAEWFRVWANREGRNEKTAKDALGRFIQNLKVLQRAKDYGLKLLQVGRRILKTKGGVVDLSHSGDGGLTVVLNTNSNRPTIAGRAKAVQNAAPLKRKAKAKKGAGKRRRKAAKQ